MHSRIRVPAIYLSVAALVGAAGALWAGCKRAECGNSIVESGEGCDDGNTQSGDGCSATCTSEPLPVCGNGTIETGETCDDGSMNSDTAPDACRLDCTPADCGDNTVDTGEECDPPGMGCDATCMFASMCGDGTIQVGEACDDGNTTSGDGCSATCMLEPFMCPTTVVLACDVGMMGTIAAGGPSPVNGYCDFGMGDIFPDETGAEVVYEFTPTVSEDVYINVTGLTDDLDVVVMDLCDPDACVSASAAGGTASESAPLTVTAGTTYFIFVDGYMAATSDFTIAVNCAQNATCGDGTLSGGEDCDDGNVTAGDGCSAGCRTEVDGGLCVGDTPPGPTVLVAGTPTTVMLGDVGAGGDVGNITCNSMGVGCSEAGPEIVAEIAMPPGSADLTMDYDHTGGDELYAVLTGDMTSCVEVECMDPYAVLMGAKVGTWTFVGVADPAAITPTTIYLVADACVGMSGVTTTVTLTAN